MCNSSAISFGHGSKSNSNTSSACSFQNELSNSTSMTSRDRSMRSEGCAPQHKAEQKQQQGNSGSFKNLDSNHDGYVSRNEAQQAFRKADGNGDCNLNRDEYNQFNGNSRRSDSNWQSYDRNSDGYVSRDEACNAFKQADANGDGKLNRDEYKQFRRGGDQICQPYGGGQPEPMPCDNGSNDNTDCGSDNDNTGGSNRPDRGHHGGTGRPNGGQGNHGGNGGCDTPTRPPVSTQPMPEPKPPVCNQPARPINGTCGNDVITGTAGDDTINTGAGNDWVDAGNGNDTVNAGAGNDVVYGGNGCDTINGGKGKDALNGGNGNDTITGGAGNDWIGGGKGDDILKGGAGNDVINGGAGNDAITGGKGADCITGGKGNDVIDGNAGNDTINGGKGDDVVRGGKGNDVINGGKGNDAIAGGDGCDTINAGKGNDWVDGGKGNDKVNGGAGDDNLLGGAGNDKINGGAGNDYIDGGKGNDTINGGKGNDVIVGGKGSDTIDGGKGNNTVVYEGKDTDYNVDKRKNVTIVTDTRNGDVDRLKNIDNIVFEEEKVQHNWTVDGKSINLDGKYRIDVDGGTTWSVTNLCDNQTTKVWGDPHVDVNKDGTNDFDFKENMTFQLADGTKITVGTVDGAGKEVKDANGNTNNVSVSAKLTITNGDEAVVVSGVNGTPTFAQSKDGVAIDAATNDGSITIKEDKGQWTTADGAKVDQTVINTAEAKFDLDKPVAAA